MIDALPVDVVHVPCICVEKTASAAKDLRAAWQPGVRVVFTSQNAVRIFSEIRTTIGTDWDSVVRESLFVTHGRSTAASLEKITGGQVACVDSPTSEGLATELARNPNAPVIWLCGEEAAFDLEAFLKSKGIPCHRVVAYRTGAHPTDADGRRLDGPSLAEARSHLARRVQRSRTVICFASPSAVRGWMEFAHHESALAPQRIAAAVIGPTTARAAAAAGFTRVTSCAWPQLADLAALGAQLARGTTT